jgi:pyruvate formate lyase activating enzyme
MGRIFDIQRFSTHDGPGVRTTVFFKGCPLRCFWCQNPEGLSDGTQLDFVAQRCTGCSECAKACPTGAHVVEPGTHRVQRDRCRSCGACVEVCLAGALSLVGREATPEDVVATVLEDRVYYERSGGGVTLSGGEPLMQPDFAAEILTYCRDEGIHTAVDTCLECSGDALSCVLSLTDLLLIDLKHMDGERHREGTGRTNERILANAEIVAAADVPVIVRVPIVPTFNDSVEAIRAIAEFVTHFPQLEHVELLPFHRLGESKYGSLGLATDTACLATPSDDLMRQLAVAARSLVDNVRVPGLTKEAVD